MGVLVRRCEPERVEGVGGIHVYVLPLPDSEPSYETCLFASLNSIYFSPQEILQLRGIN